MYLVLMHYIKLQLEAAQAIPHGVREALETAGMYSIMEVTSAEGMKVMNDGMDAGGRVVFRELWRRWQRFGRWSGV